MRAIRLRSHPTEGEVPNLGATEVEGQERRRSVNSMEAKVLGHIEEQKSYLGFVTPPVARDLFFVSTYDTSDPRSNAINKHGYQRPPTTSRFKEIGEYFRN